MKRVARKFVSAHCTPQLLFRLALVSLDSKDQEELYNPKTYIFPVVWQ